MGEDAAARCHSQPFGRPLADPWAGAWQAISRPQAVCQHNCHLSTGEIRQLETLRTQLPAFNLTEGGLVQVTLAIDEDMRQAYRSIATPWELSYSRIFHFLPNSFPKLIGRAAPIGGVDNFIEDSYPILDEVNQVIGHVTLDKTSDLYIATRDVDGALLQSQRIGTRPLESDELGNFLAVTLFTLGVGIIRGIAVAAIARSGAAVAQAAIAAGRGISRLALDETLLFLRGRRAVRLVEDLAARGLKVIVNIGGEAGKEEVALFGEHIALNHQVRMGIGRRYVPNLVKEPGENIGRVFRQESIDTIVSRKVDHTFDVDKVAKGAFKVLKRGGELRMNVFPDAGPGLPSPFAARFEKALIEAGFKDVKNIGNVQFFARK